MNRESAWFIGASVCYSSTSNPYCFTQNGSPAIAGSQIDVLANDCPKIAPVCRFWAVGGTNPHCLPEHLGKGGKIPGAAEVEQQPEPEEFAWLIDECIQQRITVISLADRRLIDLNNYKLQERAKAITISKRLDEASRERWQMWLKWTIGNLHKASNRTTFFYLVWTPLVIFYCAIAFMGMPVAVACPKPNGICHNLRVMALETRRTVLLPQVWGDKLTRR